MNLTTALNVVPGDGDAPRGAGHFQHRHDPLGHPAGHGRAQVLPVHAEPEGAFRGAADSNLIIWNNRDLKLFLLRTK